MREPQRKTKIKRHGRERDSGGERKCGKETEWEVEKETGVGERKIETEKGLGVRESKVDRDKK